MTKKKEGNSNIGIKILMICGIIAVALIIACVFFPDVIFGMFM